MISNLSVGKWDFSLFIQIFYISLGNMDKRLFNNLIWLEASLIQELRKSTDMQSFEHLKSLQSECVSRCYELRTDLTIMIYDLTGSKKRKLLFREIRGSLMRIYTGIASITHTVEDANSFKIILKEIEDIQQELEDRIFYLLCPTDLVPAFRVSYLRERLSVSYTQSHLRGKLIDHDKSLEIFYEDLNILMKAQIQYCEYWGCLMKLEEFERLLELEFSTGILSPVVCALLLMNYDSPKFRLYLQRTILDVFKKSGDVDSQTNIAAIKCDLVFLSSLTKNRRKQDGKAGYIGDLLKTIDTYQNLTPIMSDSTASKEQQEKINVAADPLQSISCNMSADQIALFLRAIDDARLVSAKSMSHVFRTIVPFLSTRHKKVLSYKAVRSKAYQPEENDRIATIQAMEKIIEMIKGY